MSSSFSDTVLTKLDCSPVARCGVKPSLQCLRVLEKTIEEIADPLGGSIYAAPIILNSREPLLRLGPCQRTLEDCVESAIEQLAWDDHAKSNFSIHCCFSKLKNPHGLFLNAMFTGERGFPQYTIRSTLLIEDYRPSGRRRKLVEGFDELLFKKPLCLAALAYGA